jgi:hypothetical protein
MARKAAKAKSRVKAKKARKAKVVGKKKTAKKAAPRKKAKKVAKKALAPILSTIELTAAPAGRLDTAFVGDKRSAVMTCFIKALNVNYPTWNDDGRGLSRKMGSDLNITVNAMQALLGVVRHCLLPTYNLNINDDAFVRACVAATVSAAISLAIRNTT